MDPKTELPQPPNPEQFTLEEILKPQHSALIVVDLQNDYLDPNGFFAQKRKSDISQMQATLPYIQKLVDAAHKAKVPVIFTQGAEDVKLRGKNGLRRAVKWDEKDGDGSVNSERGTFGWELNQIKPAEGDIIIEKHKWTSFDGKDQNGKSLDDILKEKGIETLVITGVTTETCVNATIKSAAERDYFVVVPRNSVGSDLPEQHKEVLKHFDPYDGDLVDEAVILQNWPES